MEANITIHSVIENLDGTGECERTHSTALGELTFSLDGTTLSWRESGEGGDVDSTLTVSGKEVRVVRRGAIESSIILIEGKPSQSLYKMGPYVFDFSVLARRVKVTPSEDGLSATLIYEMNLGGAERLVKMKIRADAREAADA